MLPKAAPAVFEFTEDVPVCPDSVLHWTDSGPYAFDTVAALGVRTTVNCPFSVWSVQGAARDVGVARYRQIKPEQVEDGAYQPLGLSQRQPEYGAQREL